jgi:hypothetical protein
MRRLAERAGFPLGAIATVAAGLLLTGVIAVVADPDKSGEFLNWDLSEEIEDSPVVGLGGGATAQIVGAGLASTRPNGSGYRLFRVDGTLRAEGKTIPRRLECTVVVAEPALLARSLSGNRGSYPRPSNDEDVTLQNVPGAVVMDFNAKGSDAIAVALDDAILEYASVPGTIVEWITYEQGRQGWIWTLPKGTDEAEISFAAFWRTTGNPAGKIVCGRARDEGADRGPKGTAARTSGEFTTAELEAEEQTD